MKLATKVVLALIASAALLAASQEPVRAAVTDCFCYMLCAIVGCE